MNQQKFELWLSTVCTWIKMLDPRGNPAPKTRSIDHPDAMCVVKKLLDQPGNCKHCARSVRHQPVVNHRYNPEHRYWVSRCNTCNLYYNPRTGKYDLSVANMGTINQYHKALNERAAFEAKSQQGPPEH